MRLLLVGSTTPWAIEQHFIRYLSQYPDLDLEVCSPASFRSHTIFNRISLRLGSLSPFRAANAGLLDAVERFRPDMVWVFKGVEFFPETLLKIKRQGIQLANYNPDHPFIRTSVSHGGKNVEDCVPLYDLHFCYSRELAARIEKEYEVSTVWLPFGFELDEAVYRHIARLEEIPRICFVGNPDQLRVRTIRQLAAAGIPIDIYGHHWRRFLRSNDRISIFDAVYGNAFWEKIRRYRVQLNIFRPHNVGSHNMRTFEIPAAGGIMLAPDSPEHRDFFSNGKEAFFYRSEDEMIMYCQELLAATDVRHIRENARQRSLMEDYTYQRRAQTVAQAIFNVNNVKTQVYG